MKADSKRELAEKVVDLTVMNRARATATVNGKHDPEKTEQLRLQMREEQIALHMRHFEVDQFRALLDFYSTEIGASILNSQEEIANEVHSGFRLVSGSYPEKSSS